MKKVMILLSLFLSLTVFISSSDALVCRLQWTPQAQFAGFYMAEKQGLYKKAGIDVKIKAGGPGIYALEEVISKKADFCVVWMIPAIRNKSKGAPINHIGQMFQTSAYLFIAKKNSGVKTINDLSGKKVGVWPGDIQLPPKALIRKYGIKDVNIVQQGFNMGPFVNGEIDVASAMKYNEYYQVIEAGVPAEDLVVLDFASLGLNVPEDGVYAHSDFLKQNPGVCRKFIEATMEGWKYAFSNKEETVKHLVHLANQTDFKTTEKKQSLMLYEVEKLVNPESAKLNKDDFQTTVDILKSFRIIRKDISYKDFTVSDQ